MTYQDPNRKVPLEQSYLRWREVAPWEFWKLEPYVPDNRTTEQQVRELLSLFNKVDYSAGTPRRPRTF